MKCLHDGEVMKTITLYDVTIDVCPVCNGIWLGGGELPRLTRTFAYDATPDELGTLLKPPGAGMTEAGDFWQEEKTSCPVDGKRLYRHYFAGDSGIGIEACHACHGFWLDGNELGEMWHYLKPNPALDAGARSMIRDQKELQKITQQLEQLPFKLFQFFTLAFVSPPLALLLIAKPVLNIFGENAAPALNKRYSSSQGWHPGEH